LAWFDRFTAHEPAWMTRLLAQHVGDRPSAPRW
jgi:hypothetical protein